MEATCHCKAVRITVTEKPEFLLNCNCSVCHRYGTLWCYYSPDQVTIDCAPGATKAYLWGEERIEFHHCTNCGCVTHWSGTDKYPEANMAVNARLFERKETADIKIRKFDGADKWEFIDG